MGHDDRAFLVGVVSAELLFLGLLALTLGESAAVGVLFILGSLFCLMALAFIRRLRS